MSVRKVLLCAVAVTAVAVGVVACGGKATKYADECEKAEATNNRLAKAGCEDVAGGLENKNKTRPKAFVQTKSTPCSDLEEESLDFIVVQGTSLPMKNEQSAKKNALLDAKNTLSLLFVDVVKSIVTDYMSSTDVNGVVTEKGITDEAVKAVSERALGTHMQQICGVPTMDDAGMTIYYVAYKVSLKAALQKLPNMSELQELRLESQGFLEHMDKYIAEAKK